jgi:peptidoglycan LD-endopeptidase CwlK
MNLDPVIRAVQKKVGATVDGKAGPETWLEIYDALFHEPWQEPPTPTRPVPPVLAGDLADPRSEKAIATLHERVRPYARALIHAAAAQGIRIIVTSALRTYEQQNELYAQGRSKPGKIVTGARGGYSNHNFGLAFDVTIFKGVEPVWESPAYKAVGALGRSLGLEWGGDWQSFKDEPHFQLRPQWAAGLPEREMLAHLRTRKERGMDFFGA